MRSMSVRDFESTPGQLYWRRLEPEMTSTRKGRASSGSLPFSSLGRMRLRPRGGAGVRGARREARGAREATLRLAALGLEDALGRCRMPRELVGRTARPAQQFATAIGTNAVQH